MSSHISYHPIGTDVIRRYVAYLSASDAASHAAYDYDGTKAHERFRQAFIAMAETARTLTGNFDETHGLNLAATQGFFGTYHYVHGARLSALADDTLEPYTSAWHDLIPAWQATESARNRLGDAPSSGVFISAQGVRQFMNDLHSSPELQAAVGAEFPADKLQVLWAALTDAQQAGLGLLEASGVIEPNAADITQSACRTNQTNCDPAGLRLYLAETPVPTIPEGIQAPPIEAGPGVADLLRMPAAPSLAERLRERTEDL